MKRAVSRVVAILLVLLIGVVYKMYTGESGGADVAKDIVENITNGGAITYTEEYAADDSEGVYTYSRDEDGNIYVSNVGTNLTENYEYEVIDYKIGDVYYAHVEGANLEYGSDELNQIEGYEGYDIAGYFAEQEQYVIEMLKTNGTELFDNEINADFKKEGDFYVATGVDVEGYDYRVELAKDGSSLSLVDNIMSFKVTFDTEPIVLP